MRTLIADVRLIDGVSETAREHLDVLIDGERIAAIEPHDHPAPIHPTGITLTRRPPVSGRREDPPARPDRCACPLHL